MNNNRLMDGTFFKVSVDKEEGETVYVTDASYSKLSKIYRITKSLNELEEVLESHGYRMNEFIPVNLLRY